MFLDGLPDPDGKEPHLGVGVGLPTRIGSLAYQIRDIKTFLTLEAEADQLWSSRGSVKVSYMMTTLPYCLPTDKEVRAEYPNDSTARYEHRRKIQDRAAERGHLVWELTPTASSNNYRGFIPHLYCVV